MVLQDEGSADEHGLARLLAAAAALHVFLQANLTGYSLLLPCWSCATISTLHGRHIVCFRSMQKLLQNCSGKWYGCVCTGL